jgi:hypothetical protein
MMEQKKILVLCSSPIDGTSIGSLLLRDIAQSLPEVQFEFAVVPPYWLGSETSRFKRQVAIFRGIAARSKSYQSLRLVAFRKFQLAKLVKRVSALARTYGAQRIIVTATSPEIVAIASQLSDRDLDTRIMVWDAPEYLASNMPLSRRQTAIHLAAFDKMMRGARAIAVVSDAFKRDYQQKYALPCEIIRHGIDLPAPYGRTKQTETVRIVFAGSLYCKGEWNAFVGALAAHNWHVGGKKVKVTFIGNFPWTGATRPPEIELLGPLPFDQTLDIMSKMDIGYLPYWFAKNYELVARTSFPGKMSAYAAAGLAVLHHAPPYTEGAAFLDKFPFGCVCSSLEPKTIIESLASLIKVMGTDKVREARLAAWNEELSGDVMAVRFKNFIAYEEQN